MAPRNRPAPKRAVRLAGVSCAAFCARAPQAADIAGASGRAAAAIAAVAASAPSAVSVRELTIVMSGSAAATTACSSVCTARKMALACSTRATREMATSAEATNTPSPRPATARNSESTIMPDWPVIATLAAATVNPARPMTRRAPILRNRPMPASEPRTIASISIVTRLPTCASAMRPSWTSAPSRDRLDAEHKQGARADQDRCRQCPAADRRQRGGQDGAFPPARSGRYSGRKVRE